MYKRIFKWGEDERGIEGWLMKDMPHFDSAYGLGVAHDTLEHFDNGDCISDELQAFGAIVFGRILGGYWAMQRGDYSGERRPAVQLAADLVEFIFRNDATIPARATRPLPSDDYDVEPVLADIAACTVEHALREQTCWDEWEPKSREEMESIMRDAVSWMRVGYRRAQRRWAHGNPEQFACLFYDLEAKVDELTKRGPERGEWCEMDELHISVSPSGMDFKIRVVEYRDPYA